MKTITIGDFIVTMHEDIDSVEIELNTTGEGMFIPISKLEETIGGLFNREF